MGSGGGGGDGGMMMMMMMMQMQQQQEQQRRQMEQQAFEASQKAENQNYQRYTDQIGAQNKKVAGQWDLYNANIESIKKINPNYNANRAYTFNPYAVNQDYRKSSDKASADANTDLLNKWYSDLDQQAFNDFNNAKSQYDASKTWLAEAQASGDAANRLVPGAAPGTWGAGGEQVSGGAGADSLDANGNFANQSSTVGGDGMAGLMNGFGNAGASSTGGTAGSSVGMGSGMAGSGFLSDEGSKDSLAGLFSGATQPKSSRPSSSSYLF